MRDESSALPDVELYRAILPALSASRGTLVGITSPYRRVGLLADRYRDCFGQDDPDVLVIQAATEVLNPLVDKSAIARARASDPEAASSEWDAQFRSDLSTLLDEELIEGAIDRDRPLELPYRDGHRYHCFADASGGRHDAFTCVVGHLEGDMFVADVIRGRRPPFAPEAVVQEYSALAKAYRVRSITTDNYSAEWVAQAFRQAGMDHKLAPMPKSALYLEALPRFAQGQVRIPDHKALIRELRLLERRTSKSGRDHVDHPSSGSDDLANSLVGAMNLAVCAAHYSGPVSQPVYGLGVPLPRSLKPSKCVVPLRGFG